MDFTLPRATILLLILCLLVLLDAVSSFAASAHPIVQKNLFSRSRRPNSDNVGALERKNPQRSVPRWIQLEGILIQGKTRKALVRFNGPLYRQAKSRAKSPFRFVREGEAIGDFELTRINIRSIWLKRDGARYEISLFSKIPKPLPAAPPDHKAGQLSQGKRQ